MMFRNRDLIAVFAAVLLTRLAWKESLNVTASVYLLFYYPTHETAKTAEQEQAERGGIMMQASEADPYARLLGPAMMDIDGDGTAEAWVVLTRGWKIQLLDLKQPERNKISGFATTGAPILPVALLESPPITNLSDPIAVTTGHIPVKVDKPAADAGSTKAGVEDAELEHVTVDERSRKYFCGADWHDASKKCSTPCPNGDSTKCPGDERCFADTPCDYDVWLQEKKHGSNRGLLGDGNNNIAHITTPAGSVPVIVTLWRYGVVRCDGLVVSNDTASTKPSLKIEPLWTVNHLNLTVYDRQDLYSSKIEFVDAITSSTPHGMILVTASTYLDEDYDETARFVMALNAKTGELLWETFTEEVDVDGAAGAAKGPLLLPLRTGLSSVARRRALPPPRTITVTNTSSSSLSSSSRRLAHLNVPNCLHSFRRSLLTSGALPHMHWSDNDVRSTVLHFDPQLKLMEDHRKQLQQQTSKAKKKHHSRHQQQQQQQQPKYGRPNVVVTHTEQGVSVRSLKNGHELCRVDLWDRTLYGDVNHDGLLDSVHVILSHHVNLDDDVENANDPSRRWLWQLAESVSGSSSNSGVQDTKKEGEEEGKPRSAPSVSSLCHLQVLSGLPSNEELFSVNICRPQARGGRQQQAFLGGQEELEAAPPLLVEPRRERRKGSDVVTAVSGILTRVDGETGKKQWQLQHDLPQWEDDELVVLARIESPHLIPRARPILLAGEETLAVFSPHGKKLASVKFPQPSISQPLLMDVNGDGVTDIVIVTNDAIWAYPIHLRATTTSLLRMTVGFVLLAILLALLRNRFQQHPGKRSTDIY